MSSNYNAYDPYELNGPSSGYAGGHASNPAPYQPAMDPERDSNYMGNVHRPSYGKDSLGQGPGGFGNLMGSQAGAGGNLPTGMFGGGGPTGGAGAAGASAGATPAAEAPQGGVQGGIGGSGMTNAMPIVGALQMYSQNLSNIGKKGHKVTAQDAMSMLYPAQSGRFGGNGGGAFGGGGASGMFGGMR